MVVGIIVLFIGTSIAPSISGTISKMSDLEDDKKNLNKNTPSNGQISSSSLSFHTFDKTGEKQHSVVLSTDAANDIYDMLEELKYKIVYEPRSDETKALKIEFVDMLDAYGLIPKVLSKNYVLSLLNPSWLDNRQKTLNIRPRVPFFNSFVSRIIRNIIDLRQIFKNRFEKTIDKNALISPSFADTDTATAVFCSIGSGGQGVTLPLFLLPRPRAAAAWSSAFAVTLVGELLTGKGFLAEGGQTGTALGFIGMGLTYAYPGFTAYGFVGYALYTAVTAESIDRFEPPNQEPVISDENPPSGTQDVPLSLSELSFRISDPDGDQMDYTVTTEPNIGTGTGYNKKDGVYTVPISGLEYDKSYSWTVEVTDDKDTTIKQFNFFTEGRPPFDPFDEGWQYRKKVTIDHTQVAGDLSDFPVLVSTTDSDLRDKAQNDGDDILFMDGPSVATKLHHEIEYYNGASGELISWVNIPSLSSSVDTVFYMYYGNPSSSSQQIPEKVWDSNYLAVWHLSGMGNTIHDSTSADIDLTNVGADPSQSGKIGDCYGFVRANTDYIYDAAGTFMNNPPAAFTVECWFNPTTVVGTSLCYKQITSDNKIGVHYGYIGEYFSAYYKGGGTWVFAKNENIAITAGSWYYATAVWKDNNYLKAYTDDTMNSTSHSAAFGSGSQEPWTLGDNSDHKGDWAMDGYLDEFRVSNIERSSSWLATCYNTMNDPSSFLSFGPEESAP